MGEGTAVTLSASEAAALNILISRYLRQEAIDLLGTPDPDDEGLDYLTDLFSVLKKCREAEDDG